MVRLCGALRTVSAVVSSSWLNQAMNCSSVHVLEASWPNTRDKYESGHIPGARYYDLSQDVRSHQHIPRGLPEEAEMWAGHMRALGLRNDHHVVMYDRGSMLMAARAWWTFRVFGHYKVSVLNGGWNNWVKEDLPIETGPGQTQEGDFTLRTLNKSLLRTYEDMVRTGASYTSQIVDGRAYGHYAGEAEEPSRSTVAALSGAGLPIPESMQRGHIAGSKHLEEENVLDENKCLLPEEELREVFARSNVNLANPMTTMCYNGFAACLLALAAASLNKKDVAVYMGSWTEFGQRAEDHLVKNMKINLHKNEM